MPTHPFTAQDIANSGLSGAGGVDQGQYGDCVFEASMAAVATTAAGREAISQMIVQDGDGSYRVVFPGDRRKARPVAVTQSDLSSVGVSDSATWADVLEAAIVLSDPHFANGAAVPPNAIGAADGSAPTPAQYALYLLTGSLAGKSVASSMFIGVAISAALANGQPVVAFCANNDQGALVSGHEWTVMSCNAQANLITLRNPWGSFGTAGTTQDGITYDGNAEVTMTLQLFGKYFEEVTFGYVPGLIAQVVLEETSGNSPALASLDETLCLAWTGVGNNQLNVNCSVDNGATFAGKKTLRDTSLHPPTLCANQGRLFIAWTGVGNDQLNVAKMNVSYNNISGFSGKVTLNETSPHAPSLASLNGLLYLAWTSAGSHKLNIAVSTDNGATFINKYVSSQTSTAAPTLVAQNGVLYIAWKGDGNDQMNVGQVALSGNTITNVTHVVTLPDTSKNTPALAANGALYLAWRGDGNDNLNVEKSTNGGASFANKWTTPQRSSAAPALGSINGSVFLAWSGVGNNQINVARVGC